MFQVRCQVFNKVQEFKVKGLQGYRIAGLQVKGLQNYRITGLQACPTDFYNTEIEHDLSRSGGVTGLQDYRITGLQVTGLQFGGEKHESANLLIRNRGRR
jgi:hypothetical protein